MKTCLRCQKDITQSHPNTKYCPLCRKEKSREWYKQHYQKNKDKILVKHKEYYQNNPEKMREIRRNYFLQNKEKILAKNKKRFQENPDYYKEYRLKNKDKIKELSKKWRQENEAYLKSKKKEYYQLNKEKIVVKSKKYCFDNRDKIRARSKIYRQNNKEILDQMNKEWRKNHPEWSKEQYLKNRVKILARYNQFRKAHPEKMKEYAKRYVPRRKVIDQIKYEKWKQTENERRRKFGLPLIGQGYRFEQEMKTILNGLFPNELRKDNCRYKWLDGMELDRFYPNLNLAFEYQGEGHFKEVPFFRGNLKEFQQRDQLKRELCQKAGIVLIEVAYFEPLTEQTILKKLQEKGFQASQKQIFDFVIINKEEQTTP